MAPPGTPAPVVARLNGAMKAVVGRPDFRDNLQAQAVVAAWQTPEQAGKLVADELAKWTKVIREANIKPD
jgi:tripartite-type tricarboxylate transporter receptor subunit TctC